MLTAARLVDAEEAARILRVPKSWVYKMAREGRIPCRRLGKYVRFDLRELLEWARSQRRT
ncbi:MAG: helix-turn-helix domain-containing protein [Anaerosomatales bacterium]|nr:helix-turn-helix domain-containing protein [Anaerosomatales bacterium]